MTKAENNFINYADRNTGATPAPEVDADAVIEKEIDDYAPGLLNDYGGGNVMWWQDYIREEISNCNDYWRTELESVEQRHLEDVEKILKQFDGIFNDCTESFKKQSLYQVMSIVINNIITKIAKERGITK